MRSRYVRSWRHRRSFSHRARDLGFGRDRADRPSARAGLIQAEKSGRAASKKAALLTCKPCLAELVPEDPCDRHLLVDTRAACGGWGGGSYDKNVRSAAPGMQAIPAQILPYDRHSTSGKARLRPSNKVRCHPA